ncbi:MAG: LysR substrate-binding domain-containing protein [Ahrensia sp.]|nr:LysR substrate-binding domain-containing protein [Ahrensia sp.]
MHSLDIDQLKTFLAIVEARNFTRAAERVNKTQSAVSMQMKKLEETLGKNLFFREGRGISISADGERLIGYARDIVDKSNEAVAAFDDAALRGSVYLGTADDYAERFLPAILAGFSRSNPLVEVSVTCENSYGLDKRIGAGELDMAVVTHNEIARSSELIRTEPLVWVTSSRHIVHTTKPVPLALGSPHCIWRKAATDALDRAGVEHRLLFSSYSATVVSAAVLSGLAVAVLPESALRPGMRVLSNSERFPPLPDCQIGLLRSGRPRTDVTEALARHIRISLASMGNADGSYIDQAMDPFGVEDKVMTDIDNIARPPRPASQQTLEGA